MISGFVSNTWCIIRMPIDKSGFVCGFEQCELMKFCKRFNNVRFELWFLLFVFFLLYG